LLPPVGQAQILKELSKPFELAGLFDRADAGAFGGADEEMVDGQDGAQEEPDMMGEYQISLC
jgi:nuclear GTP-binding protein